MYGTAAAIPHRFLDVGGRGMIVSTLVLCSGERVILIACITGLLDKFVAQ